VGHLLLVAPEPYSWDVCKRLTGLVMRGKGGAARAALKVVGLPQREEKLIKDERHDR